MTRTVRRHRLWKSKGGRGEQQRKTKKFQTRAAYTVKEDLRLGLLNCDGLGTTTWEDVKTAVEKQRLDLVFLLETKRRDDEVNELLELPGYKSIESLRSSENGDKMGGGIAVLCKLKEGLVFKSYDPDISDKQSAFVRKERQWVTVESESRKTAVCGLYLGCQNSGDTHGVWNDLIYNQVQIEIVSLRKQGYRIVLLGDFNGHIGSVLGQGIPGNHSEINTNGWRLLSFLKNADLVHINGAVANPGDWTSKLTKGLWTRQRGGRSTILDYGVVSKEHVDTVVKMEVDDEGKLPCGNSDHNWLLLIVKDNFVKQNRKMVVDEIKEVWNISEESDWKPFTAYIESQIQSIDESTITKHANCLSGALLNGLKSVFGLKKIKAQTKRVALPNGIVQELKIKKELKQKFLKAQKEYSDKCAISVEKMTRPESLISLEEKVKDQNQRVDNLTSVFKKMRRKEAAYKCRGNSIKSRKNFWRYVSGKSKKTSGKSALYDPESGVLKCGVKDLVKITENVIKQMFKGDFKNTSSNSVSEVDNVPTIAETSDHQYSYGGLDEDMWQKAEFDPGPKLKSEDESKTASSDPVGFCDAEITMEEVKIQVKLLVNGKAAGWDMIPNSAIKYAGNSFLKCLTVLYKRMFEKGEAPVSWNDGRLVLVHKKGPVEDINMYRPLCVIVSLSGLYSKILNERLTEVVEKHTLLGEIQNGFRRGRSCSDSQFILATVLWKARALNKDVHCAFIDLASAYPTVNREKLWLTLEKQGFGKMFINAIKALYTNDKTSTIILGERTKSVFLTRGLRQGCSLSPLLFALYVADLGAAITKTQYGFEVQGTIISGLFLADDLILIAQKAEGLKYLLALTQKWCLFKDQVISKKKSKIISPAEDSWDLFSSEGEHIMSLEKVLQYRYLGMEIFQSMFRTGITKQHDTIKKAQNYKNGCMRVSRSGPDTAELALCCWKNVAIPSIKWAVEFIPFTETTIKELEKTQAQMAKWILGLKQGAANICAQETLKLKFIKHHIYLVQLKFYQRILLLPDYRWVHKALMEHFFGGWQSKYLEHIYCIRAEVGLTEMPSVFKTLADTVDKHFLGVANTIIVRLKENVPALCELKSWKDPVNVSENENFQWCMRFKYYNAPIGHREPRVGYIRRKFCPLCGVLAILNELHLFMCPSLKSIRAALCIETFINMCILYNDSEQQAFTKFVEGMSHTGEFLGLEEMINRGKQLSSLVDKFLALW